MRALHSHAKRQSGSKSLLVGLLLGISMIPVMAQKVEGPVGSPTVLTNPEVSAPVYPRVIDVDLRDLPVVAPWRPGDAIKEVPRLRTRPAKEGEKPEPNIDPLLAFQDGAFNTNAFNLPDVNRNGQGYSGVNPPDTVGDIGANYFIQAINGSGGATYVVYDKVTGNVVAGPFSMDSLGSGNCGSGFGDPIILYDHLAQRWMISEFAQSGNWLCVYVSQTSDPVSGGWYNYAFNTPNFPDYPKYGVWPDAYYVGTNESTSKLYALDRVNMLAGLAATSQSFSVTDLSGFSFQMVTPADLDGNAPPNGTPGIFMRHRDDEVHSGGTISGQDQLQLWEFSVDWNNSSNTTLSGPVNVAVSEFDSSLCGLTSFACFGQPGTSTTLDPLREVVMFRLAYRNFGSHETLVGNLVTDVDGTDHGGIRWFELRRSGGSWSLYQEGTYAPDSANRWMGGIAMDGSGNIAVAYNVSSSSQFPSLRYAGRLDSDPLGSLPQGEYTIVNGSASNNSNRYGDYSSMGIDPVDDCTFWFTGEYNAAGSWSTRIASFSFDTCGCTPPPAPTGLTAGNNGNNRIDLSWSASAGATSYLVYRSEGACPQATYTLLGSSAGTSYSDTTVSGGVTYAYVVTAVVDSCESVMSNCADETAAGACVTPPTFAGLASVTNAQQSSCELQLAWSAATANCGSGVSYNIYRSTSSGFTPSAGNLIAACVGGTSYSDNNVSSGTTYYYIVRAEDNTGACGSGNEDTNTNEASGTPTGPDAVVFDDDIESGAGNWTTLALPADTGGSAWAIVTTNSSSPTHSWFCADQAFVKDQVVQTSSALAISGGTLTFQNFYNTESTFDGGVLEYSTNGGSTWQDIRSGNGGSVPANTGRITANGYNSTISTSYSSPIGGRAAWSGNSSGFLATVVDLTDLAGNNVTFRWRLACDNSVASTGWWVDDVVISSGSSCTTGGCSYGIAPTSASYGSSGGSGSVSVTAGAGCAWNAVSNDAWITVTSGSSGSGNGSVGYTVAANGSTSGRSGSITIAGNTFSITQSGISCSYGISPTSANFGSSGGSASVGVTATAGCGWTAVSNDAWITVTGGASGTGNGTVNYSVAANGTASPRSGSMTIAGSTFTVTQDAGTASWVELINSDFETGFQGWTDGGADCRRSAADASFAHQGTYCIRLRDNTGVASSMYRTGINLSAYSQLNVTFWYLPVSFEGVEDIFVEFYNGSTWQVIANYVRNVDFVNNTFENPSITINSSSFTFSSNSGIRIRCDASADNDRVYIDEVVISALP